VLGFSGMIDEEPCAKLEPGKSDKVVLSKMDDE
jgi:hypothetical protein